MYDMIVSVVLLFIGKKNISNKIVINNFHCILHDILINKDTEFSRYLCR